MFSSLKSSTGEHAHRHGEGCCREGEHAHRHGEGCCRDGEHATRGPAADDVIAEPPQDLHTPAQR